MAGANALAHRLPASGDAATSVSVCRKLNPRHAGFPGGSVRLPYAGRRQRAGDIAAGKDVGVEHALKIGLVDGVVKQEKLIEGAIAVLRCSYYRRS